MAGDLLLDTAKWSGDVDSAAVKDAVASDLQAATNLKLPGTPSLFINGQLYSGGLSLEALRSAVSTGG